MLPSCLYLVIVLAQMGDGEIRDTADFSGYVAGSGGLHFPPKKSDTGVDALTRSEPMEDQEDRDKRELNAMLPFHRRNLHYGHSDHRDLINRDAGHRLRGYRQPYQRSRPPVGFRRGNGLISHHTVRSNKRFDAVVRPQYRNRMPNRRMRVPEREHESRFGYFRNALPYHRKQLPAVSARGRRRFQRPQPQYRSSKSGPAQKRRGPHYRYLRNRSPHHRNRVAAAFRREYERFQNQKAHNVNRFNAAVPYGNRKPIERRHESRLGYFRSPPLHHRSRFAGVESRRIPGSRSNFNLGHKKLTKQNANLRMMGLEEPNEDQTEKNSTTEGLPEDNWFADDWDDRFEGSTRYSRRLQRYKKLKCLPLDTNFESRSAQPTSKNRPNPSARTRLDNPGYLNNITRHIAEAIPTNSESVRFIGGMYSVYDVPYSKENMNYLNDVQVRGNISMGLPPKSSSGYSRYNPYRIGLDIDCCNVRIVENFGQLYLNAAQKCFASKRLRHNNAACMAECIGQKNHYVDGHRIVAEKLVRKLKLIFETMPWVLETLEETVNECIRIGMISPTLDPPCYSTALDIGACIGKALQYKCKERIVEVKECSERFEQVKMTKCAPPYLGIGCSDSDI